MVHVAFLPPRYGPDVVGGAELCVRLLAENFIAAGHTAEVFTTCARDASTWADVYSEGTTTEGGVPVHRFRSTSGRASDFDTWGASVMSDPTGTSPSVAEEWLIRQGPHNRAMVEAAIESNAAALVGCPYLFWPAVAAVRAAPDRTILHPAAHDEAPLRLGVFGEILQACRGIVWATDAERDMVETVHPIGARPQITTGLGVIEGTGSVATARDALGLGDRPFLVCLGRVESGKGTNTLVDFFAAYKRRRPGPLALVMAGPITDAPRAHDDVIMAGMVDESTKWGLLTGADVLIHPSAYESFSFVLLEAFLARTPALVNARCGATVEHARGSGAGVPFGSYGEFEVTLDRLLGADALRAAMGEAGRRYVEENFTWDRVVSRYAGFVETLVG